MRSLFFFCLGSSFVLFVSCRNDLRNLDCSTIGSTYLLDVKPIILGSCTTSGCHNAGSGNGDYTTYAGLKAVADDGTLDKAVNIKKSMPKNGSLDIESRKKIRCWINAGAPNN